MSSRPNAHVGLLSRPDAGADVTQADKAISGAEARMSKPFDFRTCIYAYVYMCLAPPLLSFSNDFSPSSGDDFVYPDISK